MLLARAQQFLHTTSAVGGALGAPTVATPSTGLFRSPLRASAGRHYEAARASAMAASFLARSHGGAGTANVAAAREASPLARSRRALDSAAAAGLFMSAAEQADEELARVIADDYDAREALARAKFAQSSLHADPRAAAADAGHAGSMERLPGIVPLPGRGAGYDQGGDGDVGDDADGDVAGLMMAGDLTADSLEGEGDGEGHARGLAPSHPLFDEEEGDVAGGGGADVSMYLSPPRAAMSSHLSRAGRDPVSPFAGYADADE